VIRASASEISAHSTSGPIETLQIAAQVITKVLFAAFCSVCCGTSLLMRTQAGLSFVILELVRFFGFSEALELLVNHPFDDRKFANCNSFINVHFSKGLSFKM
jgi:hypothetical protein